MLYIASSLLIYLIPGNLYLLTTVFISPTPPAPASGNNQSVLWVCELWWGCFFFPFYIPHMSEIIQYLSLIVWHFTYCNALKVYPCCHKWQGFHFYDWITLHSTHICPNFFIHSSVDRHLGGFPVLAIVSINNVESTNFSHEYDSSLKLDLDLKLPRISLIPSHFPSYAWSVVRAHPLCAHWGSTGYTG